MVSAYGLILIKETCCIILEHRDASKIKGTALSLKQRRGRKSHPEVSRKAAKLREHDVVSKPARRNWMAAPFGEKRR